ncbi:MAG TPA: hypothetical protein PK228_02670 [Saprospiraceae bacterium]|nr:hypothetical protein [Saprospiraceae bacterium]
MSEAQILHREAMSFASEAFSAQREGNFQQYLALSRQAFEKEKAAAWLLFDKFDAEPTRSVLFRSAAQLAFNCGLVRETEQLVAAALVGNPPAEIMRELRQLSKSVLASLEQAA